MSLREDGGVADEASACERCGLDFATTPPLINDDGTRSCAACGATVGDNATSDAEPAQDGTANPGKLHSPGIEQGVGSRKGRWTAADRELRVLKQTGAGVTVDGLVIPYDSPTTINDQYGSFTEVVTRGACDGVLGQDCALLLGHDGSGLVYARTTSGSLRLVDTPRGLRFSATLDTEGSPAAASLVSSIERGDLRGMSWAFSVGANGDVWSPDMTRRTITQFASLPEVSVVWRPAYGSATSVSVTQPTRSASAAEALRELRRMHVRNELLRHRIRNLELEHR